MPRHSASFACQRFGKILNWVQVRSSSFHFCIAVSSAHASTHGVGNEREHVALPAEVQNYSLYVAGINAGSKQVDAAKALIAYLTSPVVKQALTANGFEPR